MAVYHVAKHGSDRNPGTAEQPFLTISRAAAIADECDTIVVHAGVYREWVQPHRGARNELGRITYTAAPGERPVIKGSEELCGWVQTGALWRSEVSNALFGTLNPYAEEIDGDWMRRPLAPCRHTGTVYMGGKALTEALSMEALTETSMQWYAEVGTDTTVFFVNTGDADPNDALMEINVRRACFYPAQTGVSYITVRGFEMAHAATPWAPPTADQIGMIGPHWSKGWIIEDNIFHDARCSAVSLGWHAPNGSNEYTRTHRKAGGVYQFEAVYAALRMGWSKETVGSHIVRNNVIYDCGQNGIVGHLGCAFSEIYGNEIYNIGTKDEFWGHELGAIKFHAPIDTIIRNNYIHHSIMGTWLDWQVQGTRLSSNVYHDNTIDIKIEVTHGPHLVDNNIFGSRQNFQNAAQGGAYVHNLFLGGMFKYPVLDRPTPYHLAHSTEINGCSLVYGGDDRYYNNIFACIKGESRNFRPGLALYNGSPVSLEEYVNLVWEKYGKCDVEQYAKELQPLYTAHNVYADGVPPFDRDGTAICTDEATNARFVTENDGVYLEMVLPTGFDALQPQTVDTARLGMPRLTEVLFENGDGTPLTVDTDLFGKARNVNAPTCGPVEGLTSGKIRMKVWAK